MPGSLQRRLPLASRRFAQSARPLINYGRMIHLDTNYLINLLRPASPAAEEVDAWLAAGEVIAVSSPAWSEFLSGPVQPVEVERSQIILQGGIAPFGRAEAVMAAELFNQTGRRRGSRLDCMIAAIAILANADFATYNEQDFKPFRIHGLKLVKALNPVV